MKSTQLNFSIIKKSIFFLFIIFSSLLVGCNAMPNQSKDNTEYQSLGLGRFTIQVPQSFQICADEREVGFVNVKETPLPKDNQEQFIQQYWDEILQDLQALPQQETSRAVKIQVNDEYDIQQTPWEVIYDTDTGRIPMRTQKILSPMGEQLVLFSMTGPQDKHEMIDEFTHETVDLYVANPQQQFVAGKFYLHYGLVNMAFDTSEKLWVTFTDQTSPTTLQVEIESSYHDDELDLAAKLKELKQAFSELGGKAKILRSAKRRVAGIKGAEWIVLIEQDGEKFLEARWQALGKAFNPRYPDITLTLESRAVDNSASTIAHWDRILQSLAYIE
jgi:hypothetical protein